MKIIAVGKIQKMYAPLQAEFEKRLSRYTKLEIIEVQDEQAPEKYSPAQKAEVQKAEWDKIEKKLKPNDFLCILDGGGEKLSSEGFSSKIEAWQAKGNLVFALGGSLGFHDDAKKRANYTLSFSDMTFTHSMARVFLLEQIYRGFKIINKEPYHK